MKRTHTCGELKKKDIAEYVTLAGWIRSYRDHGGVIFIDLRDRYGLTQIVFDPSHKKELHALADTLRREWVIQIKGKVRSRAEGMENKKLATGEIEVLADDLTILNKSEVPPLEIDDRKPANEETRLKFRYLDLRRDIMQEHLAYRHKVAQAFRSYLNKKNFLEIETPMLIKSTPEGARDYIVPSRVNPGMVYSLPQSPQLYKQLLMVSGFDRYYQIAKCLRDEDLRSDRQPEFTQIDMEMSFVDQEDIFNLIEGAIQSFLGHDVNIPIPRITYKEAIEKYGCDKPDLRFDLELVDVTDIAKRSEFSIFKSVIEKGGIVKAIKVPFDCTRKQIEEYTEFVEIYKVKGLAWMKMREKLESSIVKFFDNQLQDEIIVKTGVKNNNTLFFVAEKPKITNEALAQLRKKIAKDFKMYHDDELNFVWVTDFPLFEYDDELEKLIPAHHLFTMPTDKTLDKLESEPKAVIGQSYDLVLNGVELGSGSIRIHSKELQEKVMAVVDITKEEANEKFGFLLEALRYGAPPHGGFALGLDRLTALLKGNNDIREVMAFPKNKNAINPMDNSPSPISNKELKDVHLKWDIIKKN